MIEKYKALTMELDELHRLEESFLFVRARANELRDGDKNISYFHHKANNRKKRNTVRRLNDANGNWREDEKEMVHIVYDYFSTMLSTSFPTGFMDALVGMEGKVQDDDNAA